MRRYEYNENDVFADTLDFGRQGNDVLRDKVRVVAKWSPEAEALANQLVDLRKAAFDVAWGTPMPFETAVECHEKQAILCRQIVAIGEPCVKALEAEMKGILRGIKGNLAKGVPGDAGLVLICVDFLANGLDALLEYNSGLA